MAGRNNRRRFRIAKIRSGLDRIGGYFMIGDRRPMTVFFLLLIVTIAVDLLDSFGIDDAADRTIIDVVDGLRGPLYGTADGHRQGQESIVVVLIGDDTLREHQLDGLPLPYDLQASILADVAAAEPRAIFYDVYFPRSRAAASTAQRWAQHTGGPPEPDAGMIALATQIREIGARVPLLLGPVDQCDPALKPLRDAVAQGEGSGDGIATGVREVSLTVARWSARRYEPNQDTPRCSDAEASQDRGPQRLISAAFGLYQAYCGTARPGEISRICPHGELEGDERPMALQWGLGVSDWQADRLPPALATRCGGGANGFTRLVDYAARGLTRARWKEGEDDRVFAARCGYNDAIMASDIRSHAKYAAELRQQLKGKIVLVGVDLPSNADRRAVPYYGEVPGVFVHAMALDNLIEWNGEPARLPGPVKLGIDKLDLIQYLGLFISVFLFWLMSKKSDRIFGGRLNQARRKRIAAATVVLTLLTISTVGAFLGYLFSWSVASTVLAGTLPGGVLGLGLLFMARGGAEGGRRGTSGSQETDSA